MISKVWQFILKATTHLSILLLIYPALMMARVLFFKTDGGIFSFMFAVASFFGGVIAARVILKEDDYSFIRVPLANISILLPVIAAFAFFTHISFFRALFETPIPVVFYYMGIRKLKSDYRDVLSGGNIALGCIFISAALISTGFVKQVEYLRPVSFAFAYLAMAFILIVMNQYTLERFLKKSAGESGVPKNIRAYNTMIMIAIFFSILLLFNFKNLVVAAMNISAVIVGYLMQMILWLIGLFLPEGEGRITQNRGVQPEFALDSPSNPLYDFITRSLTLAVILYLIYKLGPRLAGLLFRSARKVISRFLDMIKRKFKINNTGDNSENGEYYDEIEILDKESFKSISEIKRKIKKLKKEYKNITDPAEKVRYLYAIMIHTLMKRKVAITSSDTAGEIRSKAFEKLGKIPEIANITEVYENVRYGDTVPAAELVGKTEEQCFKVSDQKFIS